jgi:calpain-7
LENAILAAELYMKAVKLASSDQERTRLRSKCKQILSRAEEIKNLETWVPQKSKAALLKAPSSERAVTKAEQIILLEGSKLHGFIFPPWKDDPDESNFNDDKLYTYVLHVLTIIAILISTEILRIWNSPMLRERSLLDG